MTKFHFILFCLSLSTIAMFYSFSSQHKTIYLLEMMYDHMSMGPMDWSTSHILSALITLIIFPLLYWFLPFQSDYSTRWKTLFNKVSNTKLSRHKSYLMVMCPGLMIFINNLYSIYSFNWTPSTQSWVMILITTMFLFSVWSYMLLNGGMKLFGSNIPLSWLMINLSIWLFHNLSFLIRFISLPFRMMMNLIVGCFLLEFTKSTTLGTSTIAIYEMFVIFVQTLVFLILLNMYYTEMITLPEWKHSQPIYKFMPQMMKMKPLFNLLKLKLTTFLTTVYSH